MLLSACYIVKNEGKNLRSSIASLNKIYDELIIVDTGSTDNTVAIAKEYTDKVYTYKWQEDFAAARNFAISKAQGEWVIFPDADQRLAASNGTNIRNILAKNKNADIFLVKIIDIDADNDKYLDEHYGPFILKNKVVSYSGKIHEQPVKKSGTAANVFLPEKDFHIIHTGYSSSIVQDKAERNLKLLENEDKNDPNIMIELAEAYNGVNNKDKALYYANKAVQYGRLPVTYASRPHRLLITLLQEKKAPKKAIGQAIKLAMLDFPAMPDFCAEYALLLSSEAEYEKAAAYIRKALALKKDYRDMEPTLFNEEKAAAARGFLDEWQKIIEKAEKIKISACVIVKNEEKNIRRWYDSVRQCSDEQIVVDTGSADNTVAIAENLPVRLYHFKWINDFAAAKNFAIDKAEGDWIIFLDADQYFTEESVDKVRLELAQNIITKNAPKAILVEEINIEEKTGKEKNRYYTPRLLLNDRNLRYTGMIHEELNYTGKGKFTIVEDHLLKVYHTGYSDTYSQEKAKRNLAILVSPEYQKKDGFVRWHYIADCYYGLGEYEKAVECSKKYFNEDAYHVVTGESEIWHVYINAMIRAKYPNDEILSAIKKAIKKYPELPDFYALAGITAFHANKSEQAEIYLHQALKKMKENNELSVSESTNILQYLPTVQACLTQLSAKKNKKTVHKEKVKTKGVESIKMAQQSTDEAALIKIAAKNSQWLFLALLAQESLKEKYIKFLPEGLKNLILYYYGEASSAAPSLTDAYETMSPVVFKYAENDTVQKFALLASSLTVLEQKKTVAALIKECKWKTAILLLDSLSKNVLNKDALLLYSYAYCLYYLDKLELSETYFVLARDTGCEEKESIASYLAWIKERRSGKW